MVFLFPKVYPILDASVIPQTGRAEFLQRLGRALTDSGVSLLEYRNKIGKDEELLADCATLRAAMPIEHVKLILDDRADLVDQVQFDGVHVDAGDVPPAEARRLVGKNRIVGTFGGGEGLVPGVLDEPVDYLAVGPVYLTTTKQTYREPIGPEGVRRIRGLVGPERILTAAAGITLQTAPAVLAAGANAVAVSAAIFKAHDPAGEFKRWMAVLGLRGPGRPR